MAIGYILKVTEEPVAAFCLLTFTIIPCYSIQKRQTKKKTDEKPRLVTNSILRVLYCILFKENM